MESPERFTKFILLNKSSMKGTKKKTIESLIELIEKMKVEAAELTSELATERILKSHHESELYKENEKFCEVHAKWSELTKDYGRLADTKQELEDENDALKLESAGLYETIRIGQFKAPKKSLLSCTTEEAAKPKQTPNVRT